MKFRFVVLRDIIRCNLIAEYQRVRETPIDEARCHDFIDVVTVLFRSISQLVRRWILTRKARIQSGLTLCEVEELTVALIFLLFRLHTRLSEPRNTVCSSPNQSAQCHFLTL
jgi:hypothetical protein